MKIRSRTAAKVAGVMGAGALVFGVIGPAGAAVQEVSFALSSGNITLPTSGDPVVIELPTSTGIVGTWDDVTGDLDATFTSSEFSTSRPAPAPAPPGSTITQRTQISAPDGVIGNIDPETGLGSLDANFDVTIVVESLTTPGPPPATTPLNVTCNLNDIAVTYDVTATKVPADSLNYTNLALVARPFTVPAAACTGADQGVVTLVQNGLNTALGLPNSAATSSLNLVAGAVPPPPSTTTTTIAPTTTTTAPPSTAAQPVQTKATFTG